MKFSTGTRRQDSYKGYKDIRPLTRFFRVLINFAKDFIMIAGIIAAMFSMNKDLALLCMLYTVDNNVTIIAARPQGKIFSN